MKASNSFPPDWLGKPYYSLDAYCKNTFGEKHYKIALNAGLTCPNRDGTIDSRGCIFCSKGGSGDFAVPLADSTNFQDAIQRGLSNLSEKQTGHKYIAYFQAYTNTYGPISYLKTIFTSALDSDIISGISIATRPDCLPAEVLDLLSVLKRCYPHKFIWVELGLQTINEETATYIRRGYCLSCFEQALFDLENLQIPVIVHLILGLPGETKDDMLASIAYLNSRAVFGIKLQLLHILKDTDLGEIYQAKPEDFFTFQTVDSYIQVLADCLEALRPDIVVHRVTGDAPKELLLAPTWSIYKRNVLNTLHKEMKQRNSHQGYNRKDYPYARPLNSL